MFVSNLVALLVAQTLLLSESAEPGRADRDPQNDDVVAPPDLIPSCEDLLRRAGVSFTGVELKVHKSRGGPSCGTPQAIVYRRGPAKLHYNAAPLVSCGLGLALSRFEQIAVEESQRILGSPVVFVEQGGTYSCRKMTRFSELVSEHSYANAIDIKSFRLKNGRRISVLRHWGSDAKRPEPQFLTALAQRLYDEGVFSVVLTPKFDALHRDHFHLDLARYRVDGTR